MQPAYQCPYLSRLPPASVLLSKAALLRDSVYLFFLLPALHFGVAVGDTDASQTWMRHLGCQHTPLPFSSAWGAARQLPPLVHRLGETSAGFPLASLRSPARCQSALLQLGQEGGGVRAEPPNLSNLRINPAASVGDPIQNGHVISPWSV